MIRRDTLTGVVFLLLALAVAIESYRLGIGSLQVPQAGFLPFAASCVLGILSFMLVISAIQKRDSAGQERNESLFYRPRILKVLVAVVSLFLYAAFLNTVGFLIASAILMAIMLRIIEPQSWRVVGLGAALIPAAVYFLFQTLLVVQLPKGLFGF